MVKPSAYSPSKHAESKIFDRNLGLDMTSKSTNSFSSHDLAEVSDLTWAIVRPAEIPPASRLDLLRWVMCFLPTTHLAPSNLVALGLHLQWGEKVYIQKCHRTVGCACFSGIKTSSTDQLAKPFLHPNLDLSPNEEGPKTFILSC